MLLICENGKFRFATKYYRGGTDEIIILDQMNLFLVRTSFFLSFELTRDWDKPSPKPEVVICASGQRDKPLDKSGLINKEKIMNLTPSYDNNNVKSRNQFPAYRFSIKIKFMFSDSV